jgi:hypothetical protein
MPNMGRARLAVCLIACAATFLAVPAARAFTPPPANLGCSYAGSPANTVTFTTGPTEETLSLTRVGDEIRLASEHLYGYPPKGKKKIKWHRILQSPVCNVTPTVHNTDLIDVVADPDESLDLDVSLEGGPLAPGATAELDGTSEIETKVELGASDQTVSFIGGPEPDWFRFGTAGRTLGVNLNAQGETGSPDIDTTMTIRPPLSPSENPNPVDESPTASARTGDGDDKVTTSGGPEFDGPSGGALEANGGPGNDTILSGDSPFTFIKGASGNDFLQGGPRSNAIFGGGGADTILGGAGRDYVEPGTGTDVTLVDGGRDIVAAADGMRDQVNCGAKRDFASRDPKDGVHGCELRTTQPFHLKPFE